MTILGTGVDVLHLPRITSLIARRGQDRLISRILSAQELADWKLLASSSKQRQNRFLAVRWAVKEAVYKAVYPTIKPTWKEFSYRGLQDGLKPSLQYHPYVLQEVKKLGNIHVSVSHDGEYIFASVLVEDPR